MEVGEGTKVRNLWAEAGPEAMVTGLLLMAFHIGILMLKSYLERFSFSVLNFIS